MDSEIWREHKDKGEICDKNGAWNNRVGSGKD